MKKISIVAVAMLTLAGIAYASSLGVPWFVDNAPAGSGYPPSSGTLGLVYLKNNTADNITAEITYINSTGDILGPFAPDNDFVVPALASVGFRPVLNDLGGQESATAAAIPGSPPQLEFRRPGPIPGSIASDGSGEVVDDKKNGSIAISWVGGPNDIQGMSLTLGTGGLSYAHLLPPGS